MIFLSGVGRIPAAERGDYTLSFDHGGFVHKGKIAPAPVVMGTAVPLNGNETAEVISANGHARITKDDSDIVCAKTNDGSLRVEPNVYENMRQAL
ncbi:MAG: hypothetical protein GY796_36690 [Chloroflexi bacterium]|nr:hypothetical protein [Chloroflexota bacterium]